MAGRRTVVAGLIRDVFALALRVPHPRRRRDLRRRGHDLICVRALAPPPALPAAARDARVMPPQQSKNEKRDEKLDALAQRAERYMRRGRRRASGAEAA